MALQARSTGNGSSKEQAPVGSHLARLVGLVDLGHQPEYEWQGKTVESQFKVVFIYELVNENMANAARVHAAERGMDLRSFTLVATGGAGPVHACGVASRLGLKQVLVPPIAGVGSAFGLMLAPISFDYARSYVTRVEDIDIDHLQNILDEMCEAGVNVVRDAGVKDDAISTRVSADMRYVGQGHEVRIPCPDLVLDDGFGGRLVGAFEREYSHRFGRTCEGVPVEVIHWRATVSGPPHRYGIEARSNDQSAPVSRSRAVIFDRTAAVETSVYDRYRMPNTRIDGPAIIEEAESTAVIPPGWGVDVLDNGALLITEYAT